jgi:hypothetical protein
MRTAICELLGIDIPVLAFSHCRDVVAAVTNAGGFGVLGASSHTTDELEAELSWIDDHVGGRPYGADILVPERFEGKGEGLDAAGLLARIPERTSTSSGNCSATTASRPRTPRLRRPSDRPSTTRRASSCSRCLSGTRSS